MLGWPFVERDRSVRLGRPPATTSADIERVAFELFDRYGFDETTVEAIADAAGIGRRTLFRYFPSKNDIPWGDFDASLERLAEALASTSIEIPVHEAVRRAVLDFNRLDPDAVPQHRRRMRLLLGTPALQAHSVLRYAQWRHVIADFVATRLMQSAEDLLPRSVGYVSLALALSAYEEWLRDDGADLTQLLDTAFEGVRDFFQ
jgi:mycofactocin system transcriptional regulator